MNLADLAESTEESYEAQSVIIYGPPKTGKTVMAGKLAKTKRIIVVDCENGVSSLLDAANIPVAHRKNIEVIKVQDNPDHPRAIATCIALASGKPIRLCRKHGNIVTMKNKCLECAKTNAPIDSYDFGKLDKDTIVVFDSFSQISESAKVHAVKGQTSEEFVKLTFDDWASVGFLLNKFLTYIQTAKFHTIVIAHDMEVDQTDKTKKIQPAGGTRNFAKNVPKFFGHIIYTSIKNKKHHASSQTTASNTVMAGSRTNVVVDMESDNPLATIYL